MLRQASQTRKKPGPASWFERIPAALLPLVVDALEQKMMGKTDCSTRSLAEAISAMTKVPVDHAQVAEKIRRMRSAARQRHG